MLSVIDKKQISNFLSGGGEMGERIRNFDWSKTLGDPESWDNSLKTCVRIILTSAQPMFIWWGEDLINIYNDSYAEFLSNKHPSSLGEKAEIVWAEIWPLLVPKIESVMRNEGTYDESSLFIMLRKGYSEEMYVSFCYSPVPGDDGSVKGLFCVCTETTEQVISDRVLSTLRDLGTVTFEEKSLDSIYRNVASALGKNNKDFPFALIYKISEDENILAVVASAGLDQSQNVFPDKIDITHPTEITKEFCEAFRKNKVVVGEIKAGDNTLPTGPWDAAPQQYVYLPVSAAGANHPYCIISAALNPYRKFDETYLQFCQLIGERVSLEINKMLALEEEIKRAEALAEIDKAKTLFFSNISHEFRTPLTLMLSPLEELLNKQKSHLDSQEKQIIETTHRNALRLLSLVNTLLDFSRIESGRQQAVFSLVDIVALTENLASNFRSIIEKAGMKLIVKANAAIKPVYIDKQIYEKIVFNLLSNAYKYTLQGSIIVELCAEKDFLELKIKDTGVGIPKEELPKVFDRFHRVQNSVGRTYEGTGIGLSLVKELVQILKGTIEVESELNKGTMFTLKLPFGKEHLKGHQVAEADNHEDGIFSNIYFDEIETPVATKTPNAFSINGNNLLSTVLVVDDNADMRTHIQSVLSSSFHVVTAVNGKDALDKINQVRPQLILSDIMMPRLDGIGLLKEIKSNAATSNIPVIFLTARAGEESRIEGLDLGADDYLVKPFSTRELMARIRTQIELEKRRSKALQDVYTLFDEVPFAVTALSGEDLVIEYINKYNLEIWQRSKDDVIGKPLFVARPDIKSSVEEIHKEIYRSGKRFAAYEVPIELLHEGKNELRFFNVIIDPMHDQAGKLVGQLSTSIDVTQEVFARKKLEDSESLFRELASSLEEKVNRRTLQLQKQNEELASFAYVSSHDLQEPLRKIQGFSNRILVEQGDNFTTKTKDHFNRILNASTRMQNLIDALLNYSKASTAEKKFVETDLNKLLDEVRNDLQDMIDEKKAQIMNDDLPSLPVISHQMNQLFSNIITNSLKYSKERIAPVIQVTAKKMSADELKHLPELKQQHYWKISITDNGIGFDQKYEHRIFELFQRLHSKTEYSGTGIGLAICKKIVQNHNGAIRVTSEIDKGSSFHIYLPVSNQ